MTAPIAPLRALHVVNGEYYAGAERVQDLLAATLPALGCEIGFACLKPGLFPERRHARHAPLHFVPMRSRAALGCARRIAAIARRDGYSLIHTHTPRSALVGRLAAALAGLPMVHHVHSPTARDTEQALRNRINRLVEQASLVGVRDLVAVSQSLARHLRAEGLGDRRIHVVPNGVPARAALEPRPPPAAWTLGSVALFRPRKGLEVLLQALAALRARGLPVRLRAVGPFVSEAYGEEMHALAGRLGLQPAIDWVGFSDDVDHHLAAMDTFVLPSLYGEGMPMVVLEAMAHGLPVVASDVEGIPEAVEHGVTGLVVPPAQPAALADALAALLAQPARWSSMRAASHRRHAERFSAQSMAAGVRAVYRELLGR